MAQPRTPTDEQKPRPRRRRRVSAALLAFALASTLLMVPAEASPDYHGSYVSCYSPYRPTAVSHGVASTYHKHYHEGQGYTYSGLRREFATKNWTRRYGWTSVYTGVRMNGWTLACRN